MPRVGYKFLSVVLTLIAVGCAPANSEEAQGTDGTEGDDSNAPDGFSLVVATKESCQKAATNFGDVGPSHPARTEINELVSRCIVAGYPEGNFRPNSAVTREEFAAVVAKAFLDDTGQSHLLGREPVALVTQRHWSWGSSRFFQGLS